MIREFNVLSYSKHMTASVVTGLAMTLACSPAQADDVFALKLAPTASSTRMCKKIRTDQEIRIAVADHRKLVLRRVPGQFIPYESEEARKKEYVHYITLEDLTNGIIREGAVAFDRNHAAIFQRDSSEEISRGEFISTIPVEQQAIAERGLNTFLRLHSVFNAAVDACRPYPSKVIYSTDDEFDKIEKGNIRYRDLVKAFNANPAPSVELIFYEKGKQGGFFDPHVNTKNVSYHAINPLHFYVLEAFFHKKQMNKVKAESSLPHNLVVDEHNGFESSVTQ